MTALRTPNFRRLWLAGLISDTGDWLLLASLPIVVYQFNVFANAYSNDNFFAFVYYLNGDGWNSKTCTCESCLRCLSYDRKLMM